VASTGTGLRRAFSPADAKDAGLIVEQRRKPGGSGYYYILRNQHYEDGYLVKQYGRARLELVSGLPPLEELQRFNQVRLSQIDNSSKLTGLNGASHRRAVPPLNSFSPLRGP
jgi:transcription elongation factor